jgi:hypothetical protein
MGWNTMPEITWEMENTKKKDYLSSFQSNFSRSFGLRNLLVEGCGPPLNMAIRRQPYFWW